jgi:hypothetical protein
MSLASTIAIRLARLLFVALVCASLSGCAAVMASRQPEMRNLEVLNPGVSRSQVVAELGQPVQSLQRPDGLVDTHSFVQGYSKGNKTLRVAGHVAGSLATGFLWELAGMPIEAVYTGEEVQVEVAYDPSLKVRGVRYLKGGGLREVGVMEPSQVVREPVNTGEAVVATPPTVYQPESAATQGPALY